MTHYSEHYLRRRPLCGISPDGWGGVAQMHDAPLHDRAAAAAATAAAEQETFEHRGTRYVRAVGIDLAFDIGAARR